MRAAWEWQRRAFWLACMMVVHICVIARVSGQNVAPVTNHKELLAALEDPSIQQVAIMKPFTLDSSMGPATVTRQLLITSPFRAMLNWCDNACNTGTAPRKPFLIAGPGAMVTFNRLFFKNFIPQTRAALDNTALDFKKSPVPFVTSTGGQVTYSLVVMHWRPQMFWVYSVPGTFWAQAAVDDIWSMGVREPLQFEQPQVYNVKNFAVDGTATVADCYMPVDVNGCLTDQPFDTTLVYCPYSLKDSLRNPWIDKVLIFHDIGFDRLVNSYRNPAVVNRTVQYMSCPGTMHTMDLDNITNSVVVTTGGSLTFRNLIIQGSKSQDKMDWPSHIPLLLSTFKPVGTGTIVLQDSVVQVQDIAELISALNELPRGSTSAVETPNLQPTYEGPSSPAPGAGSFTIKRWQLQQQRWLVQRVGGTSLLDKLGNNGMASWQFFNVTVRNYHPMDCFNAAYTQGSVATPDSYSVVTTGQQLIDQLANTTARYIRLASDVQVPAMSQEQVKVDRIVEVRSCHPGGVYTIDWNFNQDAVLITGMAIFEGDIVMKGIGWNSDGAVSVGQVVNALQPAGIGSVEYEDLIIVASMGSAMWSNDKGQQRMANMLGVNNLDDNPLNMSSIAPTNLLLRGFYLNRSAESGGEDGLESFLDVSLMWDAAADSQSLGKAQIAGVVVAVLVVLAAGAVGAFMYARRRRMHGRQHNNSKGNDTKGLDVPPLVFAKAAERHSNDSDGNASSGGLVGACSASGTGDVILDARAISSMEKVKRQNSGPTQDIVQACKNLVLRKTANEPEALVLHSVLGEGSYGKVFKATWKGTVVAVKIMVLPSYMTGKEKREKMAVMETAISSSLSHPNVVQTFTYTVEPVRSNSSVDDRSHASLPAASMHDSTFSCGHAPGGRGSNEHSDKDNKNAGAFSWEVRLVQEYCDLGSLKDALRQGKFKSPNGSLLMMPVVDTALDVARAMAHLHTHNILHADLKARNVLLRSDAHSAWGFTAKVADFGLSMMIDPHSTHISNAFQGTMTHMAPETLVHGQVSRASDVFAYGILLWELYTGEQAYRGIPRALLGHKITKQGVRPEFPADTPFDYQFLACRCWETDPAIRPSFEQIMQELERMKARLTNKVVAAGSGLQHAVSDSAALMHQYSLPSSLVTAQHYRASAPQRLPSVADTSDTLPTAVDKQLWEQEHQQTLQMQELQRQPYTAASGVTAASAQAAGSKEVSGPAAASAGNRVPGYTGASNALMCCQTNADAAVQHPGNSALQGVVCNGNASAGRQGEWLQSALYHESASASYYVGEDSTPAQYVGNIHSTIATGSSSPLILG